MMEVLEGGREGGRERGGEKERWEKVRSIRDAWLSKCPHEGLLESLLCLVTMSTEGD